MKSRFFALIAAATLGVSAFAAGFSPAAAEAQLKADFTAFVTSPSTLPNVGDSMPWAGGTVIRNPQRQLIYSTGAGGIFNLTGSTANPAGLMPAAGDPLKRTWANQYGVDTSRVAGVQAANSSYLNAAIQNGLAYATYSLGGNGSVTATLHMDAWGRPGTVDYDGKTGIPYTTFQNSNWFHSLVGY